MIEPQAHLAYASRGAGVLCAAFWFVQQDDVYGWFTGAKGHEHPACFFMLEGYYARCETRCFISAANDVYGAWCQALIHSDSRRIEPSPLPSSFGPELDRLQDAFVREWLFFEADAPVNEAAALASRGLPLTPVNIRASRFDKLCREGPVWTYLTPGADIRIAGFLSRRWELDYVLE